MRRKIHAVFESGRDCLLEYVLDGTRVDGARVLQVGWLGRMCYRPDGTVIRKMGDVEKSRIGSPFLVRVMFICATKNLKAKNE